MEKSLYAAPVGLSALSNSPDAGAIEIHIIPDDDEDQEQTPEPVNESSFDDNLAETLDDKDILSMVSDLAQAIDDDLASRKEWEKAYTEGLKLMGLQYEDRTEPWNGACGVWHPMITEATVRFQAETITESFPAQGPVRSKIIGQETPEKKEAAQRVEDDMNYQLTEKMPEFRPEHERMLWNLAPTGSAFKKVYFDPGIGRPVSIFCPAEDVILPYGSSEITTCQRVTHRMRKTKQDLKKLQEADFYIECDLGEPSRDVDNITKAKNKETGFTDINDARYAIYESHADLVIKGDEDKDDNGEPTGIAKPYVVTFIKDTNKVLAIRRNWVEGDALTLKRQHFVHYQYVPGFGSYGFGLIHLIGGFAKSATSILRQLVDAGTLSNLPGGMKSRGLRIKGDDTPISPGEWRDVDVGSGTIKENILPLPYKEPSQVLYTLLGNIVDEGRRFASTADLQVADMSSQAPVGTTLALLERQLKVMTAIQARTHFSFKQELKLLADIIEDHTDPDYSYQPETGGPQAKKADYAMTEIIPVSDPNAATMSQRVIQGQAALQMAQMAPQIYNLAELHRAMLETLGIKNAAKIVPIEEDLTPVDPISENMAFLTNSPTKAFIIQDHDAHISAHMSFIQDPMITQIIGQNPMAQQIQAAVQAHVAEHLGYSYRQKIQERLGAPLPVPDADLSPEMEIQLSRLVAQAAQQLLQINQAKAAQQQAQQQAQDPVLQMQQKELEIKGQEAQAKVAKTQSDIKVQEGRFALEQASAPQAVQQSMQQQNVQAQQAAQQQNIAASNANQQQAITGQQAQQAQVQSAQQAQQAQQAAQQEQAQQAQQAQQEAQQAQQAHQQELAHTEQQAAIKAALAQQAAQHKEEKHRLELLHKADLHAKRMAEKPAKKTPAKT